MKARWQAARSCHSPKKKKRLRWAPKRVRRERITFAPLHPEIPCEQRHDFHITDDALGHGTPGEKFAANVRAIRCLKRIEAEERLATTEEQEVLSRYVEWGGLPQCFEETHTASMRNSSPCWMRTSMQRPEPVL